MQQYQHVDCVSVLYREPKVLKPSLRRTRCTLRVSVSVLYREPKVLKRDACVMRDVMQSTFQCSTVSRKY